MLTALCGPTGVRMVAGHTPEDYMRDIFGIRRSYAEIELRRLADLTARHNAKLILLIQPYPCELAGSLVPALQADIAAVMADYPNVIVPDRALYEPWPGQWFVSADHLKIGHEDAASRRAGRAVAKALDLSVCRASTASCAQATCSNLVELRLRRAVLASRGAAADAASQWQRRPCGRDC